MEDSRRAVVWLAVTVVVLIVLGLLAWSSERRRRPRGSPAQADRLDTVTGWPPQVTRLLAPAERAAFVLLQKALPEHLIFAQVPLARFIDVPKRNSYADWLRRIGYQSIDFLICDAGSKVIAVVDVQPTAAQASPRALKRQARIARTLQAAKVPLHVWTANSLPSAELARDSILGLPTEPLSSAPLPFDELEPESAAVAGVAGPAGRAAAGARNPFEDSDRDSSLDEFIEAREPPSTTWYDEFDSGPTPLSAPSTNPKRHPPRR